LALIMICVTLPTLMTMSFFIIPDQNTDMQIMILKCRHRLLSA